MLPIPGPPVPPGPQAALCQGPPLCRHRQCNRSRRLQFNMHKSPNSIPADSDPPKVFQHTGFSRGVMNKERDNCQILLPWCSKNTEPLSFQWKTQSGICPLLETSFCTVFEHPYIPDSVLHRSSRSPRWSRGQSWQTLLQSGWRLLYLNLITGRK